MKPLVHFRGVLVGLAETSPERELGFSVRKRVYCWECNKLPEADVVDDQDEKADLLVAQLGGETVGSARMIVDHRPFELECGFDVSRYAGRGRLAEINRLAVCKHARGVASLALMQGLCALGEKRSVGIALCATTRRLVRLYERIGFLVPPDAAPFQLLGELHYPLAIDFGRRQSDVSRALSLGTREYCVSA